MHTPFYVLLIVGYIANSAYGAPQIDKHVTPEMATGGFGEEHASPARFASHQMPGTSRHRTRAA